MRFLDRDLAEIDKLAESLLVSRSRLVNLALENLLDSAARDFRKLGLKRRIKILLDQELFYELTEIAKRNDVSRADLIRIALREFAKPKE